MVLRESPTTQRSGFFLDFMETDAQKKWSFAINDGEASFYKTIWLPSNHNDLIESGTGSQQRRIGSKCYLNSLSKGKNHSNQAIFRFLFAYLQIL